jgi:hypothetical protein
MQRAVLAYGLAGVAGVRHRAVVALAPEERVVGTGHRDDVIHVPRGQRVAADCTPLALAPGMSCEEGLGIGAPACVVAAVGGAAAGFVVGAARGRQAGDDVGRAMNRGAMRHGEAWFSSTVYTQLSGKKCVAVQTICFRVTLM